VVAKLGAMAAVVLLAAALALLVVLRGLLGARVPMAATARARIATTLAQALNPGMVDHPGACPARPAGGGPAGVRRGHGGEPTGTDRPVRPALAQALLAEGITWSVR